MKTLMVVMAVSALALSASAADEKKGAPTMKKDAVKAAEPAKAAPTAEPAKPAAAVAAEAKPASPAGGMTVEAKLCKNLANREPVDLTDSFKVADGQVITFSRVTGGTGTELHHVYFQGDKQLDDITLKINGSPWRTNSKKTLRADQGMAGDWRVEVRDGGGAVLETLKFKVE